MEPKHVHEKKGHCGSQEEERQKRKKKENFERGKKQDPAWTYIHSAIN